jgi:riboflavin biosynthesis pyrimidine reductase
VSDWARRFEEISARKSAAADAAQFATLRTVASPPPESGLHAVASEWSRRAFGGAFFETRRADAAVPDVGIVFVESRDGNTGTRSPGAFGAGAVDEHLIYEGLSRAAADAVIVGVRTLFRDSFFSVWRREIVELRLALGYPRHPAQVVLSINGRMDPDAILLFNVPSVPVFVVTSCDGEARLAAAAQARPWMTIISGRSLDEQFRALYQHGIARGSCIGGRTAATALVDAGLVRDVYLTHAPLEGGEPGTPWYVGLRALPLDLVVIKEWDEQAGTVRFTHSVIPGSSR